MTLTSGYISARLQVAKLLPRKISDRNPGRDLCPVPSMSLPYAMPCDAEHLSGLLVTLG